jgi:hypothetical protein
MTSPNRPKHLFRQPHLRLIALFGLIVPRRFRPDWRQEWQAELTFVLKQHGENHLVRTTTGISRRRGFFHRMEKRLQSTVRPNWPIERRATRVDPVTELRYE